MTLSLHKLQSLVALAAYGSFRRAAEELHLSQPALTKHIQDLEDFIGLPLVSRTTRSLRLTTSGEIFRNRVGRLLTELNQVVRDLKEEAAIERGHLTIACVPTIASTVLPAIMASFSRKHSGVSIQLLDDISEALERRVLAHEADFGIGPAPRRMANLDFRFIVRDEFVVVLREDHPLAARQDIDARELAAFDIVAISHGNVRSAVDDALRKAGIRLTPRHEALYPQTLGRMIEEGLGIGILPSMTIPAATGRGLVTARLTKPKIHRDIGVVSRRGWAPGPAAATFLNELQRFMPGPVAANDKPLALPRPASKPRRKTAQNVPKKGPTKAKP